MKSKGYKYCIVFLLIILFSKNTIANTTDASYFEFDKETGTITGYKSNGPKDVDIPREIDGVEVVIIGEDAFYEKLITSVEIPDTVKIIGDRAFSSNKLTSIKLPYGVEVIEHLSFSYNDLKTVEISDSVNYIGGSAFVNNGIEELVISNSVEIISDYAFAINSLENVKIPYSVLEIGEGTFAMNNIREIEIPSNVEKIEEFAFAHNLIEKVVFRSIVNDVGLYSFSGNNITDIETPLSTTKYDLNAELEEGSMSSLYKTYYDGYEKYYKARYRKTELLITSSNKNVVTEEVFEMIGWFAFSFIIMLFSLKFKKISYIDNAKRKNVFNPEYKAKYKPTKDTNDDLYSRNNHKNEENIYARDSKKK